MPSKRIPKHNASGVYFLTVTVHRWYYLFDRHNRWQILADAMQHAISHKGLKVYAYVFMLNHVHVVVASPDTIACVRDFKRHTSRMVQANIERYEPHTRSLFTSKTGTYTFWKKTNMPIYIESEQVLLQKIAYIHHNPVRKQYVVRPEQWKWSSANPESEIPIASWQ